MKPQTRYRQRRDRMLKKFSTKSIFNILGEVVNRSGLVVIYKIGSPCRIDKNKIIGFIIYERIRGIGYEEMEQESEIYLGRHYDHGAFHYHYTRLPSEVITGLIEIIERAIKHLSNEIYLHIADSTALSTSVREERIRQGTRNKEKLTRKIHTMLGYDPPNQIVVVEGILYSDKHLSDSEGAKRILRNNKTISGACFGDSAYETYELIELCLDKNITPIFKPSKTPVRIKTSENFAKFTLLV